MTAGGLQACSAGSMKARQLTGRDTVKTSWLAWEATEPMAVIVVPDEVSALIL